MIIERLESEIDAFAEPPPAYEPGTVTAGGGDSGGGGITATRTMTASYDGPVEECMVCFDEKPKNQFLIAACGHNYCHVCLREHYKVKTKDGDVLKVECIDPECDREIPYVAVSVCVCVGE